MPVSPEDAGREIQRFVAGLNASKNNAREKAIKTFRTFVEKQGLEFYDDDVDTMLLGDGYTLGLLQWCGESSTGTHGALKRTAAYAISTIKWLVSLQDSSGEENIFLARFVQVAVEDLQKMKLDLHILPSQGGSRAASRGGKSKDACELISLVLQHHRNDAGEPEDVSLEDILLDEKARKIFMNWLKQTAFGKQDKHHLTMRSVAGRGHRTSNNITGESDNEDDGTGDGTATDDDMDEFNSEDVPLTWGEVDQEQFNIFNDRSSPVVPVDIAARADQPVADPLGLKHVDLRVYQKALAEDDTMAVAEGDGGDSEGPGTIQAKKRALVGQRDRLKLLKRMQSGKDRVQRQLRGNGGDRDSSRRDSSTNQETKLDTPKLSGSVVPITDNFDPALFMTIIHATASFNDIRDGLERLQSAKANQASELQSLVRDNFDSFVRCADSIEKYANQIGIELSNTKEKPNNVPETRLTSLAQLRMQLKAEREAEDKKLKDERGMGGTRGGSEPAAKSHLKELTRLMEDAKTEAGKNFSQLLRKLEKIKQVRAAQHLLTEQGSILDIPKEMSTCMVEGRYTDLVKLYKKAHTTYSSSILSQVRIESKAVGKRACAQLMDILRSPSVSLDEQIDAIAYLQDLQHDGDEPLQACFNSQKDHFLDNAAQCQKALEKLLQEAYAGSSSTLSKVSSQRNERGGGTDREFVSIRHHLTTTMKGTTSSNRKSLPAQRSMSGELTDPEDMSPVETGGYLGEGGFFDMQDDSLLLGIDDDDTEVLHGNFVHRDDDGRSEPGASTAQGVEDLEGMDLDEDLAMAMPSGVDIVTHRISVARLQHVSNLAWCLGSWLPHIISLSVLLIRQEQAKGGADGQESLGQEHKGGTQVSPPPVHIRQLYGSGVYGGGFSDYGETDTASVETTSVKTSSVPRGGTTSMQDESSLQESEDSVANVRRERQCTKAEKDLTKLLEGWITSTTVNLRAAIVGNDSAIQSETTNTRAGKDIKTEISKLTRVRQMPLSSNSRDTNGLLFAPSLRVCLTRVHREESHLDKPLDPRYLRRAFSALAHLYDSLSETLGGSWEGDVVLTPGLRSLEKLVKEAQALYVQSEMSLLATEVRGLADAESWIPPDPPYQTGGTTLPFKFLSLSQQRMQDLVDLLPRAEWSAAEVTHGLGDAVQAFLDCLLVLSTRAYECPAVDSHNLGTAMVTTGGVGGTGNTGDGVLSADHQLMCQIGNCLQLDMVVLPELWDMAVAMFDASRRGVTSDKEKTKTVQSKVMSKYLRRKYRELKLYIKNGWWGHSKSINKSAVTQNATSNRSGTPLNHSDSADINRPEPEKNTSGGNLKLQRRTSTTIARQRTSLRLKQANRSNRLAVTSVATVARQASMLATNADQGKRETSPPIDSNTRRGSVEKHRTGMKVALNIPFRSLKEKSLPSYLVKVLLSLVKARLEAQQEALSSLLYRKAGLYDGKQRKDVLYSDYVLRESARQVMDIVCDCANARVVGKGHLGASILDGSDPVEQAEKIAQVEFLREALFRYLPSATLERVDRVIKRLQAGKFETVVKSSKSKATQGRSKTSDTSKGRGLEIDTQATGRIHSVKLATTTSEDNQDSSKSALVPGQKPASVSDSLGVAMPGSFLTATNLQELARVYVVCLK
ncbi:unnamed protein product [Choristocarpus tenellus]